MLTAEEWNERYPPGSVVWYPTSISSDLRDKIALPFPLAQLEPVATDAERLAAGWLDPERAQALLDAARAWRASRSLVEKYNMDDDEIRLETVVNALDDAAEATPC